MQSFPVELLLDKQLQQEYKCPCCLNIIQQCCSTKCGHLFCSKCLMIALQNSTPIENDIDEIIKLEDHNSNSSHVSQLSQLTSQTVQVNPNAEDDFDHKIENTLSGTEVVPQQNINRQSLSSLSTASTIIQNDDHKEEHQQQQQEQVDTTEFETEFETETDYTYCTVEKMKDIPLPSVSQWKLQGACPVCRTPLNSNQDIFPAPYLDRKISQFIVHCLNISSGCTWTGLLLELKKSKQENGHLHTCGHNVIKCAKCNKKLTQNLLVEHLNSECISEFMECPFAIYCCDFQCRITDLDNHCQINELKHLQLKFNFLENQILMPEIIQVKGVYGYNNQYLESNGKYYLLDQNDKTAAEAEEILRRPSIANVRSIHLLSEDAYMREKQQNRQRRLMMDSDVTSDTEVHYPRNRNKPNTTTSGNRNMVYVYQRTGGYTLEFDQREMLWSLKSQYYGLIAFGMQKGAGDDEHANDFNGKNMIGKHCMTDCIWSLYFKPGDEKSLIVDTKIQIIAMQMQVSMSYGQLSQIKREKKRLKKKQMLMTHRNVRSITDLSSISSDVEGVIETDYSTSSSGPADHNRSGYLNNSRSYGVCYNYDGENSLPDIPYNYNHGRRVSLLEYQYRKHRDDMNYQYVQAYSNSWINKFSLALIRVYNSAMSHVLLFDCFYTFSTGQHRLQRQTSRELRLKRKIIEKTQVFGFIVFSAVVMYYFWKKFGVVPHSKPKRILVLRNYSQKLLTPRRA